MDERSLKPETRGAWILHHEQKLGGAQAPGFENIVVAGKVVRLLSAIAATNDTTLPLTRVQRLARANGLSPLEVNPAIEQLKARRLVDTSTNGVAVLGVSQAALTQHAAALFDASGPEPEERAAILLAELASQNPVTRIETEELIGAQFSLSRADVLNFFDQSEAAGFVDYEVFKGGDRVYFNGNLFRRDEIEKTQRIFATLTQAERSALTQAEQLLAGYGCVPRDDLIAQLGDALWSKLLQIGCLTKTL